MVHTQKLMVPLCAPKLWHSLADHSRMQHHGQNATASPLDGGVVRAAVVALATCGLALEEVADRVDHGLQGLGRHVGGAARAQACLRGDAGVGNIRLRCACNRLPAQRLGDRVGGAAQAGTCNPGAQRQHLMHIFCKVPAAPLAGVSARLLCLPPC